MDKCWPSLDEDLHYYSPYLWVFDWREGWSVVGGARRWMERVEEGEARGQARLLKSYRKLVLCNKRTTAALYVQPWFRLCWVRWICLRVAKGIVTIIMTLYVHVSTTAGTSFFPIPTLFPTWRREICAFGLAYGCSCDLGRLSAGQYPTI